MHSTWFRATPCCCKVAAVRGKCGLGKVANMDWHEISECAIKYATIRPGSQISKIAIFQRSNTAPASAVTMGGARRPCPRGARSTVQWIGTTLGRLQRCRPTSRARRRTRGAGVCPPRPSPPAAAGPTRHGQARLHVLPCLHGREHGSTVHLKRIPEGPCAMARRRHGAHRRHGALGARRPSSAALRVNDPRTISKVVCPSPPRTSRCCSAVPVAVEAQPRASTAGKSSSLERRGRANVQVRAAELLAFLLTEQHYRWCNCMC